MADAAPIPAANQPRPPDQPRLPGQPRPPPIVFPPHIMRQMRKTDDGGNGGIANPIRPPGPPTLFRSQEVHPAPLYDRYDPEQQAELQNEFRGLPDPDKRIFGLVNHMAKQADAIPPNLRPLEVEEELKERGQRLSDEAEDAFNEARRARHPLDRRSLFPYTADQQGERPFAGWIPSLDYDLHEDLYLVDNPAAAMMLTRDILAYRDRRNSGGLSRPTPSFPESRLVWFDLHQARGSPYVHMHRIYRDPEYDSQLG